MRKLFSIPAEKETRLWNRYMSNTYEQLSKLDSTVQDAGLYQGQVRGITFSLSLFSCFGLVCLFVSCSASADVYFFSLAFMYFEQTLTMGFANAFAICVTDLQLPLLPALSFRLF